MTGHEDPEKAGPALDWDALARFPGTLVFYMGDQEPAADRRAADRRPGATRASPRPWSSAARSRASARSSARWATSPRASEAEGMRPPAITVVGPVAGAARDDRLARAAAAPRRGGRGHARPRAGERAGGAAARAGAEVVETPAIRIEPRPLEGELRAAIAIGDYALVCLTSPNGVRLLLRRARRDGRDARALAGATVAAIGPGTAAELARARDARGRRARALRGRGAGRGARGAWRSRAGGCSSRGQPRRATCCRTRCASAAPRWTCVALYDTVAEPLGDAERAALERATYVTFTSSSTVRFLLEAGGAAAGRRADRLDRARSRAPPPREHGLDGRRRGRAARHRRPGRRAGGRCRGQEGPA